MEDQWYATIKEFFEQRIAFDRFLGIELVDVKKGQARLKLPFRPEFLGDPFRPALHGGVIATLIDVAAGAAATASMPYGSKCSTVDMLVDYLLPGAPQDLFAHASVIRKGRSVAAISVEVTQGEERIAVGRAVYSLKPASAAPGESEAREL